MKRPELSFMSSVHYFRDDAMFQSGQFAFMGVRLGCMQLRGCFHEIHRSWKGRLSTPLKMSSRGLFGRISELSFIVTIRKFTGSIHSRRDID